MFLYYEVNNLVYGNILSRNTMRYHEEGGKVFIMNRSRIPRAIAQEDAMGCGLACVASVCGLTYKSAKKKLFRNIGDIRRGFYCRELIKALARAGKVYDFCHVKINKRTKFVNGSIVFIRRSKRYPVGHYLLKTSRGWMDPRFNSPQINCVRSAFRKKLPGKAQWVIFEHLSLIQNRLSNLDCDSWGLLHWF